MSIAFRPARLEDLKPAAILVRRALQDLEVPHGFDAPSGDGDTSFQEFALNADPSGLWVAEDKKIIGFGFSWMCERFWFLAELFVLPEWQSKGIGRTLLEKTLIQAEASKATVKALITFSYNRTSLGLYINHGLFPRVPLYAVSIGREKLAQFEPRSVLNYRSISVEDDSTLQDIDRNVLGFSREAHHKHLSGDPSLHGYLLTDAGRGVGYAYVSVNGHIGPLAITTTDLAGAAFETTIRIAVDQRAAKVSAFVPGPSDALMKTSTSLGMKLGRTMVLLSSKPFADWARYSPMHPGYM